MRINLTKRPGWRKVTALLGAAAISAAALSTVGGAASADGSNEPRPTIVLVHGAFADASGWNDVTRRLQQDDYTVIATANPLRSVELRRRLPQEHPRHDRRSRRPGRPLLRRLRHDERSRWRP